jgi:hypothetical protein
VIVYSVLFVQPIRGPVVLQHMTCAVAVHSCIRNARLLAMSVFQASSQNWRCHACRQQRSLQPLLIELLTTASDACVLRPLLPRILLLMLLPCQATKTSTTSCMMAAGLAA